MGISGPSQSRLLVVTGNYRLRTIISSILAEEGYAFNGVASLEEALTEVAERPYALVLADLYAGASRHSFTPAHILRRRTQPIPVGLLTDQPQVLQQPQL